MKRLNRTTVVSSALGLMLVAAGLSGCEKGEDGGGSCEPSASGIETAKKLAEDLEIDPTCYDRIEIRDSYGRLMPKPEGMARISYYVGEFFEANSPYELNLPDGAQAVIVDDFPCGDGPNGMTVCAGGETEQPDGESYLFMYETEEPIELADPDHYYQIAFVFDSDGDESNNYEAAPQFPDDFFENTDRWYEANYDPASGWNMKVTDARNGGFRQVVSNARMIFNGTAVALVVQADEFDVEAPPYRMTIYRHRGDFGAQPPYDREGNVVPPQHEPLISW